MKTTGRDMGDDTRINQAVDEVAACIETARNVAGEVLREIEGALAFDVEQANNHVQSLGFAIGTMKYIRILASDLQREADKAQAAVKYLGAKE